MSLNYLDHVWIRKTPRVLISVLRQYSPYRSDCLNQLFYIRPIQNLTKSINVKCCTSTFSLLSVEFSCSCAGNDQALGFCLGRAAFHFFFQTVVIFYGTILNNECRFQEPYCCAGCPLMQGTLTLFLLKVVPHSTSTSIWRSFLWNTILSSWCFKTW